jgi:hypothetical protein
MKISEMQLHEVVPGLRFSGVVNKDKYGTVAFIDYVGDNAVHYRWDGEKELNCWFNVDCDCEVLKDENNLPLVDMKFVTTADHEMQDETEDALIKYYDRVRHNPNSNLAYLELKGNRQEKLNTLIKKMAENSNSDDSPGF